MTSYSISDGVASPRFSSGMVSPRPVRSRTQSLSSDRPSTVAHSLMSPPLTVSPEAAFIAAAAASQIVTNDHDNHADSWYDQHGLEPAGETALVSDGALHLVNRFLDQLLFSFLQVARATTLSALRPAVSEVLKPKLAKDAINNADEELREYLGGGDEDDYVQPQGTSSRDWDVELVWKRTRLRCMVYSSLGDMEEEDEDLWMEQENLEIGADEQVSDVISPAVAIFLTSVLEYMGELTLTVAGQAAYHRMRAKFERDLKDGTRTLADIADRILVEDMDMERVALDRTLGRLWRGWKKRIRSPAAIDLSARPYSRTSMEPPTPRASVYEAVERRKSSEPSAPTIVEDVQPSDIALPMGNRDVEEIEVPGLATYSDDEDEDDGEDEIDAWRPKSLLIDSAVLNKIIPTSSTSRNPMPVLLSRKRSNSLPLPGAVPFYPASKRSRKMAEEKLVDNQAEKMSGAQNVENTEAAESEVDPTSEVDGTANGYETMSSYDDNSTRDHFVANDPTTGSNASVTAPHEAVAVSIQAPDSIPKPSQINISDAPRNGQPSAAASRGRAAPPPLSLARADQWRDYVQPGPLSAHPITPSRNSSLPTDQAARGDVADYLTAKNIHNHQEASREAYNTAQGTRGHRGPTLNTRVPAVSNNFPSPLLPHEVARPTSEVSSMTDESPSETVPINEQREYQFSGMPRVDTNSRPAEENGARHLPGHIKVGPVPVKKSAYHREGISPGASTKPAFSNSSPVGEQALEGHSAESPRGVGGHPGRIIAKNDGIGRVSVERTRVTNSDEDSPLPVSPRQLHTSTSSHSSGTGKIKAVRTSEDNSQSHAESVARNFEELIHSNQTITYTLTPENMRDIDSKAPMDSPVVTRFGRRSEDTRGHLQTGASNFITNKQSTPARTNGLTTPLRETFSSPLRETFGSKVHGQIDKAVQGSAKRPIKPVNAQPREARVPEGSTADFAEFIKSTGPPGETAPTPSRNVNANAAVVPSSPVVSMNNVTRKVSSASSRNRYQPREASSENRDTNVDLIDFLRQGPPANTNGNRIPRHVAPFRNAMDPDTTSPTTGGRVAEPSFSESRYSQPSTNITDNSGPSVQSSINSRTALVKGRGSNATGPPMFDEDDMMPKRKTRRVRDPYQIDFSDEEDDELLEMVHRPPPKREESLAEFLQNYEPPPSNNSSVTPKSPEKSPKKKSSAPSLMGRFTRSSSYKESTSSANRAAARSAAPPPAVASKPPSAAQETRSLSSRASGTRKYVPIQVNIPSGGDSTYNLPGDSFSRPRLPSSISSPSSRVPMKKFEPRDAVSTGRTSDLADFFRDSTPPPQNNSNNNNTNSNNARSPPRPPQEESSSGFSRMFGRRKKSAMA